MNLAMDGAAGGNENLPTTHSRVASECLSAKKE
jgi:hypothetical protein